MINLLDETIIRENPFTRLNIYCPGQPQHSHTFFEFIIMINGKCLHILNGGEKETIENGTLLLIRPSDYHEINFASNDGLYRDYYVSVDKMKNICTLLGNDFYDSIINSRESYKVKLTVDEFNSLLAKSALFNNINYYNTEENHDVFQQLEQIHTSIIFGFLSKFIEQRFTANGNIPDWLNNLYLHLTYFDYVNMELSEIIKKTGYSHGYVSQMFKKYFNCSLLSYHNRNKVLYSCKLLGNKSVIEIASLLGWDNPKNYSIEFKKIFNCSPREYLKQIKKNK